MTHTAAKFEKDLIATLEELDLWVKGQLSTADMVHGSVTGDYENQAIHALNGDNARIIALSAKVEALIVLHALFVAREEQARVSRRQIRNLGGASLLLPIHPAEVPGAVIAVGSSPSDTANCFWCGAGIEVFDRYWVHADRSGNPVMCLNISRDDGHAAMPQEEN